MCFLPPVPQSYKELYTKKWTFTQELAISIAAGLQKMLEAKADVNKMKGELAIKNQDLAVAAKEAEVLLKEVSVGKCGKEVEGLLRGASTGHIDYSKASPSLFAQPSIPFHTLMSPSFVPPGP